MTNQVTELSLQLQPRIFFPLTEQVLLLFSHVWLFATPWTTASQALLSFTISPSLLKFTSIKLVMPSNHLVLRYQFLLLPSIFPVSQSFPLVTVSNNLPLALVLSSQPPPCLPSLPPKYGLLAIWPWTQPTFRKTDKYQSPPTGSTALNASGPIRPGKASSPSPAGLPSPFLP